MRTETEEIRDNLKYLSLLARDYPSQAAAASEIISTQALLKLPKGTEHFMSDLHGENEAFVHILNSASGVIREKVDIVLGDTVPEGTRAELATLNGYMDTAEAMTKYVIRYVLDNCPDEMAFFNQFIDKGLIERLELVANSEFGRISYTDAIEILKKNNKKFQFPVEWGVDIQTEHERYLTEVVFKKPVFVTDYPKEIKSFYMKQNADGKTVAAADMLVPGIGELIGGSQREEDYDKLVTRMDELGLDKSSYDWYLNLRKFGGVEHAGYGLGFERMIMYLTGIQNIRDVLPFPRTAYGF